jgi:DNA polymerase I-like protein with 3'-5' exonuclease and polymerase domains
MKTAIFDIETNGLLRKTPDSPALTKVHCICIHELETGFEFAYHEDPTITPRSGDLAAGVKVLAGATTLIGHNISGFDIPALRRFFPDFAPKGVVFDTLVASRLFWTDMKDRDFIRRKRDPNFPMTMIGRHSLEAWGQRLHDYKGSFGKDADWSTLTQEMLDYCMQDVGVTRRLYEYEYEQEYSSQAIVLEHEFAEIIDAQMSWGVGFDSAAAADLFRRLQQRRLELELQIVPLFDSFTDNYVTPKTKQARVRVTQFNPRSRPHIVRHLRERHGWKPTKEQFTDNGSVSLDEDTMKTFIGKVPGMEALVEHFLIQKRIGAVAEGNQAWLRLVEDDGRIHGYVNHNGAVTGRCTHSRPNVTQTPSVLTGKDAEGKKVALRGPEGLWGWDCRNLFVARDGWSMVGADMSGLELRCFAHYVAKYDGGAYAKIVTEGDVHTQNQKAAGLTTRDQANTFIYAFLYGAGAEKIGSIVGGGEKEGKELLASFRSKMPAVVALQDDLLRALRSRKHLRKTIDYRGREVEKLVLGAWIRGMDGRRLFVRSLHSIVNTLLQAAGAVAMKQATVLVDRKLNRDRNIIRGVDYCNMIHAHDELQLEVKSKYAEEAGQVCVASMQEAGRLLDFRCPLTGEYKIGRTWADTH